MKYAVSFILGAMMLLPTGAIHAQQASPSAARPAAAVDEAPTILPPPHFERSPAIVQGLGTLYVDPKTLPAGPFVGYDSLGNLTNITYMLPQSQLEQHQSYSDLGRGVPAVKIDHTDITFSTGHPGISAPHYLVTEWVATASPVVAGREPPASKK